jgi:hypothetical protein
MSVVDLMPEYISRSWPLAANDRLAVVEKNGYFYPIG